MMADVEVVGRDASSRMMAGVEPGLTRASPHERDVVRRLLELSSHEFSRIDGRAIGHDGLYPYRYLDAYGSDPDRGPYLFRAEGELAGMALVRRVDAVMHVSEFLVLPKFRRTGVGSQVAQQPFAAHRGPWQTRQVAGDDEATSFWRRAIPVPFTESVDAVGTVTQTFDV